ncbi:MAG: DUF4332 domain-containing protein [Euryarchaeota archaeon]|nr:DUF4332 domain-containing protein [Euryarchaeota archaeon]
MASPEIEKLRIVLDYVPCDACLRIPCDDQELFCSLCSRITRTVAHKQIVRRKVLVESPEPELGIEPVVPIGETPPPLAAKEEPATITMEEPRPVEAAVTQPTEPAAASTPSDEPPAVVTQERLQREDSAAPAMAPAMSETDDEPVIEVKRPQRKSRREAESAGAVDDFFSVVRPADKPLSRKSDYEPVGFDWELGDDKWADDLLAQANRPDDAPSPEALIKEDPLAELARRETESKPEGIVPEQEPPRESPPPPEVEGLDRLAETPESRTEAPPETAWPEERAVEDAFESVEDEPLEAFEEVPDTGHDAQWARPEEPEASELEVLDEDESHGELEVLGEEGPESELEVLGEEEPTRPPWEAPMVEETRSEPQSEAIEARVSPLPEEPTPPETRHQPETARPEKPARRFALPKIALPFGKKKRGKEEGERKPGAPSQSSQLPEAPVAPAMHEPEARTTETFEEVSEAEVVAETAEAVEVVEAEPLEAEAVGVDAMEAEVAEGETLEAETVDMEAEERLGGPVGAHVEEAVEPEGRRRRTIQGQDVELAKVPGIGALYGVRLAKGGVKSLVDLLDLDIESFSQRTGISARLLSRWQGIADLALHAKVPMREAEVLVRAGIVSTEHLASSSTTAVVEKALNAARDLEIAEEEIDISEPSVAAWIEAAQRA